MIPEQIKHLCRFIRLKKRDKKPVDDGWQKTANYAADDPVIVSWIESGGNYGVMPGSDVYILDGDAYQRLSELGALDIFKDTFTVLTGSEEGDHYHYYFECSGFDPKKIPFFDNESGAHLGELYPAGCPAYVVGPGSVHPSGRTYTVENDAPLKVLTEEQIDDSLFSKVRSNRGKASPEKKPKDDWNKISTSRSTITDICRFRIEDIAYPTGEVVQTGDEIQGSHPVHESTTGSNYSINPRLNIWRCWRDDTGGDPTMMIAVKEGIISCVDALPGALHNKERMKALETVILSGKYGGGPADLLRKHKAAERQNHLNAEAEKQQKARDEVSSSVTIAEHDTRPLAISKLNLTDIGNGLRFVAVYGDKFRFDHSARGGMWHMWNGQIWEEDKNGCTKKAAQYTIAKIAEEIETLYKSGDEKAGDAVYKHMKKSASDRARSDMLRTASAHMSINPDVWNNQPNLFNCLNGTLELDTFKFRDFRQEDYLTLKAGVKYDPDAKCPQWEDHLNLVFGEDAELISAFQIMSGYSLLSGNPAQVFFILYGAGKNGKSVTINALRMVCGGYGIHIAPQSLMQQKNPDRIRSDLVRLRFKRLVTSAEGERGAKLDIGWIKQMTGGEPIVAAEKYKNEVEFIPEFSLWFATNHLPEIKDASFSIWRRILAIPFNAVIPEESRIPDYEKKLVESEGSGILNWCLDGLKRYYNTGELERPAAIEEATEEYKIDEDPIGDYLSDCTVIDPAGIIASSEIYADYLYWCNLRGIKHPMSQTNFSTHLKAHEGIGKKTTKTGKKFLGIRLKTPDDTMKEIEAAKKAAEAADNTPNNGFGSLNTSDSR